MKLQNLAFSTLIALSSPLVFAETTVEIEKTVGSKVDCSLSISHPGRGEKVMDTQRCNNLGREILEKMQAIKDNIQDCKKNASKGDFVIRKDCDITNANILDTSDGTILLKTSIKGTKLHIKILLEDLKDTVAITEASIKNKIIEFFQKISPQI